MSGAIGARPTIDIRSFTISQLAEACRDGSLWLTDVVPISRHRAVAHAHNPRADTDDVVLFVAYDDIGVLAYIGVLPDLLFLPDGAHKIGWLSTWWGRPGGQGGMVAVRLLMTAIGQYEQSVGASNFTPEAARVYEATRQFVVLRDQAGVKARIRPQLAGSLLGRLGSAGKLLFRMRDGLADVRLGRWRGRHSLERLGLEIEYTGDVDAETERFIAAHSAGDISRKGKAEIDWITRWPWVLHSALPDRVDTRYFFGAACYRFVFMNVKVFGPGGEMIAFVLMRIRNSEMTVPFAWYDDGRAQDVMTLVAHHMVEAGVMRFKTFQPDLAGSLRRLDLPYLRVEEASRRWLITKRWDGAVPDSAVIHDGDGDNANF